MLWYLTIILFRNGYYGLNRPSSFAHDFWKKSLGAENIETIEDKCKEFMEKVGYQRIVK